MTDLRKSLFAAAPDGLAALCDRHREEIVEQFPQWAVLPEPLRGDREAAERWAAALMRIAERLQYLGEPRPLAWLTGEGREDPVARWNAAFAQADGLVAADRPQEAVAVLRALLTSLEQSDGPIVDGLLAPARGKLAVALFALGDMTGARTFFGAALEACVAVGDLDGMRIYREDLDVLDAVTADEPLATLRAQLAEAQDLSDAGRFGAANEILMALARRDDIDRYRGKLCGLAGLNLYRLDELDAASAWTEVALDACHAAEDWHGVIIYTENLRVIGEARSATA